MKVEVLNGADSIGGNFVRVEDGDRVIIFDQGLRFDILRRYYGGFVAPRGLHELRALRAVPMSEWYRDACAIYVSHMHLDHLGLLANIPSKVSVRLPSLSIYESLEEKWHGSPTWLSMVPRKYYVKLEEIRPLEADDNDVTALPVSHSAHPAYAFMYFGSDGTLLYTGDFRIEGFCLKELWGERPLMLDYISENRDIKVDTLVIEGTNLGSSRPPISPAEEEAMLKRILAGHTLVAATTHSLDAEYAAFLAKLASESRKPLYIASEELAMLMERNAQLPVKPLVIGDYVRVPTRFEVADALEKDALILTSYREAVDLLRDLGDRGLLPKGSAAILSEPEPQAEEAQDYDVMLSWFNMLGVQAYRMRVSGHYYPYQLEAIISKIKPKKIVSMHTVCPHMLMSPLSRF